MLLTEFDEEKDWAIIAKGFEEIGFDKGIEKGREEGIKKGKNDKLKEIINNMISNGITKDNIIKFTGISEKDYDNIFLS